MLIILILGDNNITCLRVLSGLRIKHRYLGLSLDGVLTSAFGQEVSL